MPIKELHITECPRDAMQGLKQFIPTDDKIEYLQSLISVGFDTLDYGSFVSPKAIPQLADTADVTKSLDLSESKTKLLAIIANIRGAEDALQHDIITYLGFPLSVNETFQQRNTNKSIAESLIQVKQIQKLAESANKKLVVYLSMAFGNPYGDPYTYLDLKDYITQLVDIGTARIMLSDTIGSAKIEDIKQIYHSVSSFKNQVDLGLHLHSTYNDASDKSKAAFHAGCEYLDSALLGIGGCPMAKDELVGNLPTEVLIDSISPETPIFDKIDKARLEKAIDKARSFFPIA